MYTRKTFRGRVKTTAFNSKLNWLYGSLIEKEDNRTYLYCKIGDGYTEVEVDTESVGQFTGVVTTKHKRHLEPEVFEGDIFRYRKDLPTSEEVEGYTVVMWVKERAAFYCIPVEHYQVLRSLSLSDDKMFEWLFEDAALSDFFIDCTCTTKVGNVYDNPDYLERKS